MFYEREASPRLNLGKYGVKPKNSLNVSITH
jgi:hypothetical protein